MEAELLIGKNNTHKKVFADRKRTNLFKVGEQRLILFLLNKIPAAVTPNGLTLIGLIGSIIVLAAFLAAKNEVNYLLLGVLGLFINWFGDSLDGRLAYYRAVPRKWFGFALDILMDWTSTILIGLGYYFYVNDNFRILGVLFMVFYAWAMLIALLKYKITGKYEIDNGSFGPTELRVVIMLIIIAEVIYPGTIVISAILVTATLSIINLIASRKLLQMADFQDIKEKVDEH